MKTPEKKKRISFKKSQLMKRTFVKEWCKNGYHGTQAAIDAGYSPKSARTQASALLRQKGVIKMIEEEEKEMTARLNLDQDKVLRDLEVTRRLAQTDGQYGVAVRATELQGKHLEMFVDRTKFGLDTDLLEALVNQKETLIKKIKLLAQGGDLQDIEE